MKKFICFILLALNVNSTWAEHLSIPYIEVTGTASSQISPDLIHWSVQVNHQGYQLKEVAEQHQKQVAKILTRLQKVALKKDSLQTTQMRFGEKTKYQQNNRVNDGYFATTNIQFTLTDLNQYQKIWLLLAEQPNTSINYANFDSSLRAALSEQTKLNALLNAKINAEKMAQTLNVAIGEPLMIEDNAMTPINNTRMVMQAESFNTDQQEPISAGKITISSQVKVKFKLLTSINFGKNNQ